MAGRGRFSSPGLTTDRGSDLKLQRRSWRYDNASLAITLAGEFSYCGQTTSPGCCTCRGPLRWRAVIAGDGSYWPGKLIFVGVINTVARWPLQIYFEWGKLVAVRRQFWPKVAKKKCILQHFVLILAEKPRLDLATVVMNRILLLTLAGEFSNLLLLLTGALSNKKWQIITFSYEKVKIEYFFMLKSDKSLLFHIEKWQIFTYSRSKIKSFTATDRGTPFYLPGKEYDPRPNTKLLLSALIKA